MADAPKKIDSLEDMNSFINGPGLAVVHFFAPWAPQCAQLNTVLVDLVGDLKNCFTAAYIDAEEVSEVSVGAKIKAVPTICFYKSGKELARLDGFHPAELRTMLVKLTSGGMIETKRGIVEKEAKGQSLNDRLKALINRHELMLFMKGDPAAPKCGFSRTIVGMLNEHQISFGSFDILSDEEVRQGLKEYSNWPTYPQLYHKGELLGGLDVVREEFKDADFIASLPKRA
ncbi:hypothetical protein PMAYCL1PPCAC_29743 [Pristionchus mayeri]|uniref:Glrx-3 n=1 Tax=Pristionchus mayeri TaxID=1317129 RepID=A0AAN5IB51_9BILA|nr:hypothetical protein PMAYCL1PPCAC_29743 [Pristionchus mayeri]